MRGRSTFRAESMTDAIVGRRKERAQIARFFELESSGPRALLLEGDAGMGKSTLWREAVELAQRGGRTLVSRPSEAEAQLSFTVLGDLFAPVVGTELPDLPGGQRRALEAALLLGEGTDHRSDPRALSLAVLTLLRSLAADGPVTLAIDDLQWIDVPSARALAFAMRRLDDELVSIVATMRTRAGLVDPVGVSSAIPRATEHLGIGPLGRRSLGQLLREAIEHHFPPPLVDRIHATSGGNPLFALEIARASAQGGDQELGELLPLPEDLGELMRARIDVLSPTARATLLLAASAATPTSALLLAAGAEDESLREAEEADIVMRTRAGGVGFVHPLFASVAYAAASPDARREAHERLARTIADPEEAARHRALAAEGPDEPIARTVEEAARRVEARGAPSSASELYRLAATLTPPEADRMWYRRYKSATCSFAAGDASGCLALLERLLADLGPGLERATTLYTIANGSWNDVKKVGPLLERALEDAAEDPLLGVEIGEERAWAALLSGDLANAVASADGAIQLADELEEPERLGPLRGALSARALASAALGQDASDPLGRGIALEGVLTEGELSTPRAMLGRIQTWMGDLEAARISLHRELDRYLEQGHASGTWEIHVDLADLEFRAGRWAQASSHAREAEEIAIETGWSTVLGQILPVKAMIAAAGGGSERARADATMALDDCRRMGDRWNELKARATLGFVEITDGDPIAAHGWLEPAVEISTQMGLREPGAKPFIPDAVEALIAVGDVGGATALTDRLAAEAGSLDRPLARSLADRCRGIVAVARRQLADADDHLQRALRAQGSLGHPFERGRTLLAAGEVHRRMRKQRSARELLGDAREIFQRLGSGPWMAKADRELAKVGGRRAPPTDLTPAEEQVARLVAEGRTNREVAAALFLSVHTVDAHLRRVYRKLQVRSRTELARKL
jgi:DNA-binding CsgD family transcriptional regulator